jgi:hypothetical protein
MSDASATKRNSEKDWKLTEKWYFLLTMYWLQYRQYFPVSLRNFEFFWKLVQVNKVYST